MNKRLYYSAVFEPDTKNGGFTVTIPSLPGCISEGNTFEEAFTNIKEAAQLYIETMENNGLEINEEKQGPIIAPIEIGV